MAATDFTYAGNSIHPGTSSQHRSIQEDTYVRQNEYDRGVYDSPPTVALWRDPNNTGTDDQYNPTMPDGFAGTGSAGREFRNAPHPAPGTGHAQYHILNMPDFKNLEDRAISMRISMRNNAGRGGYLILFAYAEQSELMAFANLPEWSPGNQSQMYNTPLPGIYAKISGHDNSMSIMSGYRDGNKFDTMNPIHQMADFDDYFGYNRISDFTSMRLDIIPWSDNSGVKNIRFRLFQAVRNYHPLSESAWQDYTRVSATDPSPSAVQDPSNKIAMVEGDRTYTEVFGSPDPNKLAGNPLNGAGNVCGFGFDDGNNYPGGSEQGYSRIGVTNFEVRILDQGI